MKPVGAHRDLAPVDDGRDAEAGHGLEGCRSPASASPRCFAPPHDGLRDRMLGARFHGRDEAQDLGSRRIRQRRRSRSAPAGPWSACRSCRRRRPSTSFRLCRASPWRNSTPEFGRAAGADHDRGRRRKAHGAGAGDDQHRDGIHEREGQRRLGTEDQPDAGTSGRRPPSRPARTTPVTLSTRAWIGSFEPCACSTMRMICASTVSAPILVARKVKLPVLLIVPPTTSAPSSSAPAPARR